MAQAEAKSSSRGEQKTDAAASGKNAKATSSSMNTNGQEETTTSWTEKTSDGFITKKMTSYKIGASDGRSDDSWTLVGDDRSARNKRGEANEEGEGVFAAAGRAFAGVVNGKAVASTNRDGSHGRGSSRAEEE